MVDDLLSALRISHDVSVNTVVEHDEVAPEQMREKVVIEKINNPLFDSQIRALAPRHVSNALKHHEALQRIATGTRVGAIPVVIEDDPVFDEETVAQELEDSILKAPSSWQAIMLGLPGRGAGHQPMKEVYRALPLCNAYAIRPGMAAKLAGAFLPVRYTTNVHLSYLFEAFDAEVLLRSPGVITDGSKEGTVVSRITAANELSFDPAYATARRALDEGNLEAAADAISRVRHPEHPDNMHLRALLRSRRDGPESAKVLFREALEAYEREGAIVNNESRFLSDYIDLFRPAKSDV